VTIDGPLLWNALSTDLGVLPNKKFFRNRYIWNNYTVKLICQCWINNS